MNRYDFCGAGNENDVTVNIFYLVSNGNDVTVSFCGTGNDAHLCINLLTDNFNIYSIES
jgi:hypothetical protein